MGRKSIRALIEKVVNEETHYLTEEGKLEVCTLEEAYIRTAAKRAMDPKNRLGMESTRFLTEYQYGKPTENVKVSRAVESEFDEMSEEELLEAQYEIMGGAISATTKATPQDPGRFIEEGRRAEIIQGVVESRGEDSFEKLRRVTDDRERERREADPWSPEYRGEIEDVTGTDELLEGRDLINDPWF